MGRSIRPTSVKRKRKLGKPRNPNYTSSHPRPVKITYMEGFGPPVQPS